VLQKNRRRRKLSVEVHRVKAPTSSVVGQSSKKGNLLSYEECIVRVLDPDTPEERRSANKRAKERRRQVGSGQVSSVASVASADSDDDESTVVPMEFLDHGSQHFALPEYDKGWKAKYRFPIRHLTIKGTHRTGVIVNIDLGKVKQTRELIFDTLDEAEDFRNVVNQELSLEKQRAETKLKAALSGRTVPSGDITFLVEIVSAWNIEKGDIFSSDPYVICMLDGKEVHRTKHVAKT